VAFGSWTEAAPKQVRGAIVIDGEERRAAERTPDLDGLIGEASRVLEAVGERLEPGDRVITGNLVQVAVGGGARVEAEVVPLGSVWLELR
jgi:hypothetical protein